MKHLQRRLRLSLPLPSGRSVQASELSSGPHQMEIAMALDGDFSPERASPDQSSCYRVGGRDSSRAGWPVDEF